MRDAVVVGAVRTAVGKRGGALAGVHPADLSAAVLRALIDRTGVDPKCVDDVIWGCVTQVGEQTYNIGRTAVLSAGWPETVPATTVDRQCGSSQQALHFAAAGVVSGQYDIAVAGGVESMSRAPMGSSLNGESPWGNDYKQRYGSEAPSQGLGAEMIAERWGLSRADVDAFAVRSHARAISAADAGLFADEIVPVTLEDGTVFDADQGLRRGGSVESLASLTPAFKESGVLHAGNSSQISDGSAALMVTTSERASKLGLQPLARVRAAALAGADPTIMLTAPLPATHKVLAQAGLSSSDVGVFEVNEAFASVPMAWLAEFDVDPALVNPMGGAIALGHPLGGSGARIATTLLGHMRRNGIQFGLQTMCEGGGLANATIFELCA